MQESTALIPPGSAKRTAITFTIVHEGVETTIETYTGAYRNLMVLLNECLYLEGFGDCGGMGRCGTCTIAVVHMEGTSSGMQRNEESTLQKKGLSGSNLRLACQILVNDELQHAVIEIR